MAPPEPPARMVTYITHFAGSFVARCPICDLVCASWDDEDLDEDGHLYCHHPSTRPARHASVALRESRSATDFRSLSGTNQPLHTQEAP